MRVTTLLVMADKRIIAAAALVFGLAACSSGGSDDVTLDGNAMIRNAQACQAAIESGDVITQDDFDTCGDATITPIHRCDTQGDMIRIITLAGTDQMLRVGQPAEPRATGNDAELEAFCAK